MLQVLPKARAITQTSIHDPTPTWHRLNQRPGRPELNYLDYLDSSPQNSHPDPSSLGTSPPRHPSPKHLSRPLSRNSPRPAGFTLTSPATYSLTHLLACLLACLLASFILLDNRSPHPPPFSFAHQARSFVEERRTNLTVTSTAAGGRDSSTRNNTPATSVSSILVPADIPVR
ncbi:hypothetical protein FJTKL_07872 [Diaporthe vaccinii]|uniref:Uncharacterized protein n=1 Tax=Diaporthe vaccinii TaxID=105482 RepID=A0ABR4FDM5_9PEZI